MAITLLRTLPLLAVLLSCGCATNDAKRATRNIIRLAGRAQLTLQQVDGHGFHETAFMRIDTSSPTIWVFLEGDGSPWIHQGTVIATDPTARNPLALHLAIQTPGSIVYLNRPCYAQGDARMPDSRCMPALWTSLRYSQEVVTSMNVALDKLLPEFANRSKQEIRKRVVLVGYSGGGTLAVLMAHDNPNIAAVVTIAGNLDITAWAQAHSYEPLVGSRNPADESALPRRIAQIHLVGDKDVNVSATIAKRYLQRLDSPEQVWHYADFDHVCCWTQQWPIILQRLQIALDTNSINAAKQPSAR